MEKTTTYLTTTTLWHDARKELPTESGDYLAIIEYDGLGRCGYITTVSFSAKHRLFNASDCNPTPCADLHQCIFAWARPDELFSEVYDFMHKGDENDGTRSLHSRSA